MSNWLLTPANWSTDFGGPPPPEWDGSAYAFSWPSVNSNRVNFLQAVAPTPGTDNIAGTVTFVDRDATAVFLVYASDSSGTTIYGSVPVAQGVPTAFDFPAEAGTTARLYIANSDTAGATPAYYYGVTATVLPEAIPPAELETPYVVGQYLRAYFGADTPLALYVRGEEGPLDLADDDLTVQATWPWAAHLSIPATGDADGRVAFTITQAMLWRTWGDDYGINVARYRGQRSLLRVISAQRGVLALAYLEIA